MLFMFSKKAMKKKKEKKIIYCLQNINDKSAHFFHTQMEVHIVNQVNICM